MPGKQRCGEFAHRAGWKASAALMATMALVCGGSQALAAEPQPEIVSLKMIWDAGEHNAFTDLTRWHDRFWVTFREAEGHVGGNGKIRVLVSTDGDHWESAALLAEEGVDLRDPKFSVTPDDRLMLVLGGSIYDGKTLLGRQPRVAFSKDGREWTVPEKVLTPGEWLWRVTWHDGTAYGASYNASVRKTNEAQEAAKSTTPVPPGPAEWKLKIFSGQDGVKYDGSVTFLDVPGHPNETTLRFVQGNRMMALVRREGGSQNGWIGISEKPPYKKFAWKELDRRIGGPNFIELPNGQLWAVCRDYLPTAKTKLFKMDEKSLTPVLEFPSGGDTSYAGLLWHDDLLWVSYYSSHENKKSRIYLAKVKLP
jgi:hypothetical protein